MKRLMQHDTAASSSLVAGYGCADILGAPFGVYLQNGYTERPGIGGDDEITITDVPGLLAAVVQARVLHPRKLTGSDLKFIRTALRLKSKMVADAIELTPEHYSRCETGGKIMSAGTEKAYRMFAFLASSLRDQAVLEHLNGQQETSSASMSPKKQAKVLAAFLKVFTGMKIEPATDVTKDLSFSFYREEYRYCGSDNDNEPEWGKVEPPKAA